MSGDPSAPCHGDRVLDLQRKMASEGIARDGRTILVTGASGKVGREVAAALRAGRIVPQIATRSIKRNSNERALDFQNPSQFDAALAGVDGVFLMRPPAIADTRATLNLLIDRAEALSRPHVCFLSVAGAGRNPLLPHHAVEKRLKRSSLSWTILRAGFFAQNFTDAYRCDLAEHDRIYVPAGEERVAFVDTRDIGAVAAMSLLNPGAHAGRIYELTGPAAYSFGECARILTGYLRRPIRYEAAPTIGYFAHLRRQGLPLGQCAVQTLLHVGLRFGQAERVDPTLTNLLGDRVHDMDDFLRDFADTLRRRVNG